MDRLRYGFIGAGAMARGHMLCLKEIPEAAIVAVADTAPESIDAFKAAGAPEGISYCSEYREVLERDDVDAVLVATPDFTHVDIVTDVLAAGKHVFSEKPAATARSDLDRLDEAVRSAPGIYMLGFECRYLPVFREIRRIIDEGKIGRPRMIWCREFRRPFYEKVGNWILFNDKTGGVFVEKTCHFFDLMTWFAGAPPVKVVALAGQDVVKEIYGVKPDVFDNGWVLTEYANGVRACLGLCMFAMKGADLEIDVLGDTGRLESLLEAARVDLWEYGPDSQSRIDAALPENLRKLSHSGGVYLEHLEFIECVREGREPLTGLAAGRTSALIGLAAEESARAGGKPISL